MKKNPKIAIVPEGVYASFEAGQKIDIKSFNGNWFTVISPKTGQLLFCLVTGCSHLDGKDWILE